jgi:zinc D-Ala-D-Ala dipeptidase
MQVMSEFQRILTQPIPLQVRPKRLKQGYRTYPLLASGPHANEPLVDIAQYGIAGQSYYSRPNSATGDPVPGVERQILVRRSLAERLAAINYALQTSDDTTKLFGRPVELYVNEGYRSLDLQRKLYDDVFPALIRRQNPDMAEKDVLKRRDELIASPEGDSPSPHSTGAAVDLCLRYAHPDLCYVPRAQVPMGRDKMSTGGTADPDYFEHHKGNKQVQQNRRIFYWVMRGALLHDDSGLAVNPTEWWHWSYGDQLWAALTEAPCAFFAASNVKPATA